MTSATPTTDLPSDGAYAVAVVEEMDRSNAIIPPTLRSSFTFRYVIALALVATLTVLIGWSGIREINTRSTDAAVVNVSGKQRMLSQRIALFAGQYAVARGAEDTVAAEAVATRLLNATSEMASAQQSLLEGDEDLGLPGNPSPEVADLYASDIEGQVNGYLATAEAILDAPTQAERERIADTVGTIAGTGELLGSLNAAVAAYQAESEERLGAISRNEFLVVGLMLLVLALEALLVFRPMSHRIRQETHRLAEAAARHKSDAERHGFGLKLRDAVELADNETDLVDVVALAQETSLETGRVDLLLSDRDEPGRLLTVLATSTSQCSVDDVEGCPALRRGQSLSFDAPNTLEACPQFRRDARDQDRTDLACVCVPLTFLGAGIGVLRTVTEHGEEIDEDHLANLETVARAAGTHLGTLRAFESTRAAADQDPLTGLLNRRGLETELLELGPKQELAVIAIDLDHFKNVNDTHGHAAGDQVIAEAAMVMTRLCRPTDLVARIGGEEFVVVLPIEVAAASQDILRGAAAIAERIRVEFESITEAGQGPACTASLGLAGPGTDFDELLKAADEALYESKSGGRNQVTVHGA